jgi:ABC-type Fe3+-citrate transport system substrate-binding protein
MGGTDVTEVTRRCVTTECACADGMRRLAMKPVVLARKNRVSDKNFRGLRKHNDCAEHDEWRSGVEPASLSKS